MAVREKFLYEIWKEKKFTKELTTTDLQKIEVIDVGLENKDSAGPDFLNCRIKFGNITYLGDVEIDTWHSDWKSHGHYIDKKFSKVILHIVLSNDKHQPNVYTKDGRKVNSICLKNFLDEGFEQSIRNAIQAERKNRIFNMPCSGKNDSVRPKEKMDFIFTLGIERFKKKSQRILERMKHMIYLRELNIREPIIRYDFGEEFQNKKFDTEDFNDPVIWQQLAYEMIFEALGYSMNKDVMLQLAKAVNIQFLLKYVDSKDFINIIESSFFNVSGLIQDKRSFSDDSTTEYVRNLVEQWNSIKQNYDGPTFTKDQWHFLRMRPYNFPTIRLAGGARLVNSLVKDNLMVKLIGLFSKDNSTKQLVTSLRDKFVVIADGYWRNHFLFEKPANQKIIYFIGVSRADEIIVNVFLPLLNLYFELFPNPDSSKRVKDLYLNYMQKSSNELVKQVSETLDLQRASRKSIYYQGIIELFRSYCVKERCMECKIGQKVFD